MMLSLLCAPFHFVHSANTEFLLTKSYQVLNRSSKCVLFLPLIYNQNWKKSYSWEIHQQRSDMKFSKVLWWVLWDGDPSNFHNRFFNLFLDRSLKYFWKNYYLNFKYCKVFFLKSKKDLHNKDSSHIKIDCRSKRPKKKHERKRKSQTTAINMHVSTLVFFI